MDITSKRTRKPFMDQATSSDGRHGSFLDNSAYVDETARHSATEQHKGESVKIGSDGRVAQACVRCRTSKVKCDGVRPACTRCVQTGVGECVYIEAKPRGRKKSAASSRRRAAKSVRQHSPSNSKATGRASSPVDDPDDSESDDNTSPSDSIDRESDQPYESTSSSLPLSSSNSGGTLTPAKGGKVSEFGVGVGVGVGANVHGAYTSGSSSSAQVAIVPVTGHYYSAGQMTSIPVSIASKTIPLSHFASTAIQSEQHDLLAARAKNLRESPPSHPPPPPTMATASVAAPSMVSHRPMKFGSSIRFDRSQQQVISSANVGIPPSGPSLSNIQNTIAHIGVGVTHGVSQSVPTASQYYLHQPVHHHAGKPVSQTPFTSPVTTAAAVQSASTNLHSHHSYSLDNARTQPFPREESEVWAEGVRHDNRSVVVASPATGTDSNESDAQNIISSLDYQASQGMTVRSTPVTSSMTYGNAGKWVGNYPYSGLKGSTSSSGLVLPTSFQGSTVDSGTNSATASSLLLHSMTNTESATMTDFTATNSVARSNQSALTPHQTATRVLPDSLSAQGHVRKLSNAIDGSTTGQSWSQSTMTKRLRLEGTGNVESSKTEERGAPSIPPYLLKDAEDPNAKARDLGIYSMADTSSLGIDHGEPPSAKAELLADDTPSLSMRELVDTSQLRSDSNAFQTLLRLRSDSSSTSPFQPPSSIALLRTNRSASEHFQRNQRLGVRNDALHGTFQTSPNVSSTLAKPRMSINEVLPKLDVSAIHSRARLTTAEATSLETTAKFDTNERIARPEAVAQLLTRLKYFVEPGNVGVRLGTTTTVGKPPAHDARSGLMSGRSLLPSKLVESSSAKSSPKMDWSKAIVDKIKMKIRDITNIATANSPITPPPLETLAVDKVASDVGITGFAALQTQHRVRHSERLVKRLQKAVTGLSKNLFHAIGDAAMPGVSLGDVESVPSSTDVSQDGKNLGGHNSFDNKATIDIPSSSVSISSDKSEIRKSPKDEMPSEGEIINSVYDLAKQAIEALELLNDAVDRLSTKNENDDLKSVISTLAHNKAESHSQSFMSVISRLSTVFASHANSSDTLSLNESEVEYPRAEDASAELADLTGNDAPSNISVLSETGTESISDEAPVEAQVNKLKPSDEDDDKAAFLKAQDKTYNSQVDCGILTFVLGHRSIPACFCNSKFSEMLGYTEDEISAILNDPETYESWITNYNRESYLPMLNAFVTSAGYYFRRSFFRNKCGDEQPVLVTYNLYYDHRTRLPLYMLLYVKPDYDRSDSSSSVPEFPPPAQDVMGSGPFRGPLQAELLGAMTYPFSTKKK